MEPSHSSTSPAKSTPSWRARLRKLTDGMTWYGLELSLATIGLIATSIITTYGIYALVNYLKGIDTPAGTQFMGEFSLWVAATMLVWLPLGLVYYLRTRAETTRHTATEERWVHKLFVSVFLFQLVMLIAAIVFSIVYALLRIVVGIDDQAGDTAVRVVVPGLLAIAFNLGLFWAYSKHNRLSRTRFAGIVGVISLVVTLVLLGVSVTHVQGTSYDAKASADLYKLESKVSAYYTSKYNLPSSLSDLDGLDDSVKGRLDRYTYKKEARNRYQLCATFKTDTQKDSYIATTRDNEYSTYASFGIHGTGEKCFKLSAGYSKYDDITEPMFPSSDKDSDSSLY